MYELLPGASFQNSSRDSVCNISCLSGSAKKALNMKGKRDC